MKNFSAAALLIAVLVLGVSTGVRAQDEPSPSPTPTPDPLSFNDAAMHFQAPKGYLLVGRRYIALEDLQGTTPVAEWVKYPNELNQRLISIAQEPNDGSLRDFEDGIERQFTQGNVHKYLTQTSNGMPAYWMVIQQGSGLNSQLIYQYVWVDGKRGVIVGVVGQQSVLGEREARDTLSDLSAVEYPEGR